MASRIRIGRGRGRLQDLTESPFKRKLRFESKASDPRGWWNGLLYSRFQLLALPELESVLSDRRYVRRHGKTVTRLPEPHQLVVERCAKLRRIALALIALEARYMPKLDPERIQLTNTNQQEWEHYRATFDPVGISRQLDYSSEQARADAEWLLLRAHNVDPLGSSWSQLMRRAPRKAWKDLKGVSLIAMGYREAAELLLLFYEDLAAKGEAEPLPSIPYPNWHPLHERLSHRRDTLDQNLMSLGISPHPRVVLAIEGDTEQVHVPLVWQTLGYPDAPELMRVLKLGTVDRDLEKVAALAAAPLVGGKIDGTDDWWLIKPPTRLMVAVDPEGRYFGTPQKVVATQAKLIEEIKAVLRAQGVTNPKPTEIDELVQIRTWSESCYEFAHFSDDELADGIMAIHTTINGLRRDQLTSRLALERGRGKDIRAVWSLWDYKPSKVDLAHMLWPKLEEKIRRRLADETAPTPEIAEVIYEAYIIAQHWRYQSFVLGTAKQPSQ